LILIGSVAEIFEAGKICDTLLMKETGCRIPGNTTIHILTVVVPLAERSGVRISFTRCDVLRAHAHKLARGNKWWHKFKILISPDSIAKISVGAGVGGYNDTLLLQVSCCF
jgi:hypothetical protein